MDSLSDEPLLQPLVQRDLIRFRGHPMVRSEHPTTIEVTTEEHLSDRGDCIIGVGASKGCAQLDDDVKRGLRRPGAKVALKIVVGMYSFALTARGDPGLQLTNPRDIVVRKSTFLSDRTICLGADAAAKDIPRPLVRLLRDPKAVATLELEVM